MTGTDPSGHGWFSSLTPAAASAFHSVTAAVSTGWNSFRSSSNSSTLTCGAAFRTQDSAVAPDAIASPDRAAEPTAGVKPGTGVNQ
jgi:hypothetical protein